MMLARPAPPPHATLLAVVLCAWPAPGRAQFGATAVVERPIPAGSAEDPTASATVVETRDRPAALERTSELLREVPGARTRGTGAFTGLSLRGADLDHTKVLFGDVPLDPGDGGGFDLSTIPLSLLERVEVYRGGVPLTLGPGAIGGVIRLVPHRATGTHAEGRLGMGSFGERSADATASVVTPDGSLGWKTVVGMRHTDGDYPFLDDSGTTFDASDDVQRRRQNGRVDQGHGLAHVHADALGGTLELLGAGFGRTGGLTGAPVEEPTRTRRSQSRAIGSLSWRREGTSEGASEPPWRVRMAAGSVYHRQRLIDRFGEISVVPRVSDDATTRTFVRAAGGGQLGRHASLGATVDYRWERHAPDDRLRAAPAVGASTRHRVHAGAEARLRARLGSVRTEVRPSVGIELVESDLRETRQERAGDSRSATALAPSYRLGLVVEPWRGVAVGASVASATRVPTVLELFGDRGFVLGDTRLSPERSVSVDGGALLRGRAGPVSGLIEVRGFGLFVDDLIRYVRTSQFRIVPQNVSRATMAGVEGALRGRWGRHVALSGALTWLRTLDHSTGRDLPLRPELETYVRPEVSTGPLGPVSNVIAFVDLTYVSSNFAGPANRVVIPSRLLVGAGLAIELAERRLRLAATGRDLTGQSPYDLVGFPLPGRSFSVEMTVRTGGNP